MLGKFLVFGIYVALVNVKVYSMGVKRAELEEAQFIHTQFSSDYAESFFLIRSMNGGFSSDYKKHRFTRILFSLYLCSGDQFGVLLQKLAPTKDMLGNVRDPLGWRGYYKNGGFISINGPCIFIFLPRKGALDAQVYDEDQVAIKDDKDLKRAIIDFELKLSTYFKNKKNLRANQ